MAELRTYDDAIADVVAILNNRIDKSHTSATVRTLSNVRDEIERFRARQPQGHKAREAKLEGIIDGIAERIIEAAEADISLGAQRPDGPGNVVAAVPFGFPEVCRWLRWSAGRGNTKANDLLRYIASRRSPSIKQT